MTAIGIATADKLFDIGVDAEMPLDGDYVLLRDIDCSGVSPEPIGNPSATAFTGSFNGDGYSITDLTIDDSSGIENTPIGLFGFLGEGAEVKNVKLLRSYFSSASSKLNCPVGSITGKVALPDSMTEKARIINCIVEEGQVLGGKSEIGGLIGTVETSDVNVLETVILEISRSSFEGSLSVTNLYGRYLGGLVGSCFRTDMQQCYSQGSINNGVGYPLISCDMGGLIGEVSEYTLVKNCYAQMSFNAVTGYSHCRLGGLICNLYGANLSGERTSKIENCYAVPILGFTLPSQSHAGGLVYEVETIPDISDYTSNCHWDNSVNIIENDATEVVGETKTPLQKEATFVGWNFENIWYILEEAMYPNFERPVERNQILMLEYRNENKGRWSAPRMINLGNTGDTDLVREIRKLGSYKTRQYRLTWSTDVPIAIALLEENVCDLEEE